MIATVLTIPSREILRMLRLGASKKKRSPAPYTAILMGATCAMAAGPPSPEEEPLPFPATVVMVPSGVTSRMRLLSAMKTLPE